MKSKKRIREDHFPSQLLKSRLSHRATTSAALSLLLLWRIYIFIINWASHIFVIYQCIVESREQVKFFSRSPKTFHDSNESSRRFFFGQIKIDFPADYARGLKFASQLRRIPAALRFAAQWVQPVSIFREIWKHETARGKREREIRRKESGAKAGRVKFRRKQNSSMDATCSPSN